MGGLSAMTRFIIHDGVEFQFISFGGLSYRLIKRQHGKGPNLEVNVEGEGARAFRERALTIERCGRTVDEMCGELWDVSFN